MPAVDSLERLAELADGSTERTLLERTDHLATGHPAEVASVSRLVLGVLHRDGCEGLALLELAKGLHDLPLLLAQDVPDLDVVRGLDALLASCSALALRPALGALGGLLLLLTCGLLWWHVDWFLSVFVCVCVF